MKVFSRLPLIAVALATFTVAVSAADMREWTNPETGVTVSIPAVWKDADELGPMVFRHARDGSSANLRCDQAPPKFTFKDYEAAINEYFAWPNTMQFQSTRNPSIRLATVDAVRAAAMIVIMNSGQKFCRLTHVLPSGLAIAYDPDLAEALFDSLAGTGPQATAGRPVRWKNPDTNFVVTLPNSWTLSAAQIPYTSMLDNPATQRSAGFSCVYADKTFETFRNQLIGFSAQYGVKWDALFAPTDAENIWRMSGSFPDGVRTTLIAAAQNSSLCFLDYRDRKPGGIGDIDDQALTALLLTSTQQPDIASLLDDILVPTIWTNPKTGATASFPMGWQVLWANEGADLTLLKSRGDLIVAYYCSKIMPGYNMIDYMLALPKEFPLTKLSELKPTYRNAIFQATGQTIKGDKKVAVLAVRSDEALCRIYSETPIASSESIIDYPDVVDAIFATTFKR